MTPARQADPELDSLIAEITIDAYDEDEQLQAFENAFDEDVRFPLPGKVAKSSARTSTSCQSARATVAAS